MERKGAVKLCRTLTPEEGQAEASAIACNFKKCFSFG